MKNLNKLLSILIITILLFTPCYASAEEETIEPTVSPTPSESPSPSPSESPKPTESPSNTPKPTESPEPTTTPETKSIKLNETKITLDFGKTVKLSATVNPSDSTVIWKSSNKEIVTVDENGKVTAGNKDGEATITATIEDTDIKAECKVVIKSSGDIVLEKLKITNGTLNKTFKSDILEYSVIIDKDVTKLKYEYELSNENAGSFFAPSDTKNKNLKNGDILEFKVVGKETKIYKLTIIKETTNLNLKQLEINGYALNEIFKPEQTEYTASIPYEIETITVKASAESDDVNIKNSGLTNLKVGENTVTVTLKDEDGNSKVYKIIVTREKEVTIDEKPTSIITSDSTSSNNESTNNTLDSIKNNDDDSFLKYAIVSLACLILFVIGGIGIYFYLKTSPKRLRKELNDLKEKEETNASPMLEVQSDNQTKKQGNIEDIIDEKLVETREFKKEDLEEVSEPEKLIDDSKDV